uniref:Uncharacterized protein n=1 Tax=Philodina roseola TaxID=96448 RepID=B5AHC9_PHIRO|nr:hypothetical protein 20 [Philodina roseola]
MTSIDEQIRQRTTTKKSIFSACCSCSKSSTNETSEGFFKRIQFFKAKKRQSIARKQQLAATLANETNNSTTPRSPSDSMSESERLFNESNEPDLSSVFASSPYPTGGGRSSSSTAYSPRRIRTSRSIPLLNRHRENSTNRNDLTTYSFTDIEIASTLTDEKRLESIVQTDESRPRDFSSIATNLSAFSTQSLLKKLLDKAQVLNEYYNEYSHRTDEPMIERKRSSDESIRKKLRRKRSSFNENFSTESSRFNLYADEDNVLKELIQFNNDIDLILSRLEMEGENCQGNLSTTNPMMTTTTTTNNSIYRSDDSGLAASPSMPPVDQ